MTTITLDLPDSLARRADEAARAMHRPLAEVITAMLDGVLPSLEDVPQDMQAELVEMTWWDDARLIDIVGASMSDAQQQRLARLSTAEGSSELDRKELDALRCEYGRVTLRKARAFALLSVRSGRRLLALPDAA
jgi:hypothetical protein